MYSSSKIYVLELEWYFGIHHGAMGLEKIVSTELERIFLKYEAKHILKV